jgi:hypothetical protein
MIGPQTFFGWVGRKDADSASLVKLISDGIIEANRDGTMKALQQKWFGFTMTFRQQKCLNRRCEQSTMTDFMTSFIHWLPMLMQGRSPPRRCA